MKQQTKEVAETITDEEVRDESVCRALVGLREDVEDALDIKPLHNDCVGIRCIELIESTVVDKCNFVLH